MKKYVDMYLCYPMMRFKSNKGASLWLFVWGLGASPASCAKLEEEKKHEKLREGERCSSWLKEMEEKSKRHFTLLWIFCD